MGKFFITVARQECQWCGKLFKTTRHECKFDPELRNCFSCIHSHGQERSDNSDEANLFRCDAGCDGYNHVDELISTGWKSACDKWEMIPGYTAGGISRKVAGRYLATLNAEDWKKAQAERPADTIEDWI